MTITNNFVPATNDSNFAPTSSVRSISPLTTQLLATTANAAQPARARAILHELSPATNNTLNSQVPTAYSFLPAASQTNTQISASASVNLEYLQNLHPTNPFKNSLEAEFRANHPESPLNQNPQ